MHPSKQVVNAVIEVLKSNNPLGMAVKPVHPSKVPDALVIPVNASNKSAGTVVRAVQFLKVLLTFDKVSPSIAESMLATLAAYELKLNEDAVPARVTS